LKGRSICHTSWLTNISNIYELLQKCEWSTHFTTSFSFKPHFIKINKIIYFYIFIVREVLSFPRKRESRIKRAWIPNQVGDDKLLLIPDKGFRGWQKKTEKEKNGFSVKLRMTKKENVIPAKAGIQEVFVLQTNKRKRVWIPNQVGDDKLLLIPDKRFRGLQCWDSSRCVRKDRTSELQKNDSGSPIKLGMTITFNSW